MSLNRIQAVEASYALAKTIYADWGVDTEAALRKLATIPISLHCWQGDDVAGFESSAGLSCGGILATGNYPGRARNGTELRQDLAKAMALIPGTCRVNLHASYAETSGRPVGRDELRAEHFQYWSDWAKDQGIGLDFNPTFFSHELAGSGYTLASKDPAVRGFWIEHAKRSREIAAALGQELGGPCVNNLWIPDGSKDLPVDRWGHRVILAESLDTIYRESFGPDQLLDAVESKLFGIGSESYVVGSHEFYLGYALSRGLIPCLDMGHFHPTEGIADKISALLIFAGRLLLHVSRGVRWDSDHVPILNDDLVAVAQEVKRCDAFDRVWFALDFFDASINRITAWVTGTRALRKALLAALLEPTDRLREAEERGNFGDRLALLEEVKTLPLGAVWNQFCLAHDTPFEANWIPEIGVYEREVLSERG